MSTVSEPVIVLVHGLGLKTSQDHELRTWSTALQRGLGGAAALGGVQIRMAYYSPQLHPEVRYLPLTESPVQEGARRSEPATSVTTDVLEERIVDKLVEQFYQQEPVQPG